jgi:ABC-type uncharacterized transport system permease subunit
MSVTDTVSRRTTAVAGMLFVLLIAVLLFISSVPLDSILTVGFLERTLRAAAPIALAAIGGLYAEKSGVFNIGLEGFLIFGAFIAVAAAWFLSGNASVTQFHLWLGVLIAVGVCTVFGLIFAVLTIRYKANQIVAGLAVWFLGLGFAPFAASVIWNDVSSPPVPTINDIVVPGLASVPIVGKLLFAISPMVVLAIVIAVAAWVVLYRTQFGYWIQAAGENPEALETAGVDVNRVRYATVTLSGTLSGLGGAALSVGFAGGFTGTGATLVNGRGWIAITAYLLGNYNPLSTFAASVLFGGADALQVQLQTVGISLPQSLISLFPYIAVLVVLVLVGRTRMPSAAGEPYESEE